MAGETEENPLFTLDLPGYRPGELENAVKASLEAVRAARGIPPARRFLAHTAVQLARSIDKGNMKGRAVANESQQLVATMDLLDPPAAEGDPDALPADLKAFLDAFAAPPRLA